MSCRGQKSWLRFTVYTVKHYILHTSQQYATQIRKQRKSDKNNLIELSQQ